MATAASRDERNFCQTSIRHKKRGGGHKRDNEENEKGRLFLSAQLQYPDAVFRVDSNIYRECAASDVSPSSVKNMAGILLNTGTMI